jgi:hypothetical protein
MQTTGPLAALFAHADDGVAVEVMPVSEHEAALAREREKNGRYWQALTDIAGLENWEPKTAGDIARAALAPSSGDQQ